ncbi:hypothetical protein [Nonomuraea sp. NPDC050202]|jgi:hypothetical protein|uniref:hypothetical protein n=1 Tax=Nonomuraea sp. NPDC050202 TaxID=3155035 RepID=UPI0034116A80
MTSFVLGRALFCPEMRELSLQGASWPARDVTSAAWWRGRRSLALNGMTMEAADTLSQSRIFEQLQPLGCAAEVQLLQRQEDFDVAKLHLRAPFQLISGRLWHVTGLEIVPGAPERQAYGHPERRDKRGSICLRQAVGRRNDHEGDTVDERHE